MGTACEKLPVEICGAGCVIEEGVEECHDKVIASVVDVPEESCDLNPLQTRWCLDPTPAAPGELYDEAGESDRSSGLGVNLGAALELPLRTARRATWRK